MTARLEATSSPEIDTRQHGMEILTPKSYGIAGRLLVASAAEASDLHLVLNPAEDIKTTLVPYLTTKLEDPTTTRDVSKISKITQRLSTSERAAAWDGTTDLDAALTEWVRGFTTYATHTTKEGRRNTISGLAGKDATTLTEVDSRVLYETFCKDNESKTGEYVNATIGRLKGPDGKVDVAKLQAELDDIQWLASRFFGVETAKAVAELVKLEAELTNNKPNTINVLLKDPATSRIDDFYKEEAELLSKLLGEPVHTRDTAATRPVSATPPPFPPAPWPTPTTEPSTPPHVTRAPWDTTPAPTEPEATVAAISDEELEEAMESETGKKVENLLGSYVTLLEKDALSEEDEAERLRLISELDETVGNRGAVSESIEKIHTFYKKLKESGINISEVEDSDDLLRKMPTIEPYLDEYEDAEQRLYVTAFKNTETIPTPGEPITPQPIPVEPPADLGSEQPVPTAVPEPMPAAPTPTEVAALPEEQEDAPEPAVAPPSRVRTEQQILNDIAQETGPRNPKTLEERLAEVQAEIESINAGTFRGVDGRVLPQSMLDTLLESDREAEIKLKQAIQDQNKATDRPLFATQDQDAAGQTQPVPQEDEPPQPRVEQPEEVLTPLPDAPEPPLFTTQDAATADEPIQPVTEQEQPSNRNPFSWVTEGFRRGSSGQD